MKKYNSGKKTYKKSLVIFPNLISEINIDYTELVKESF